MLKKTFLLALILSASFACRGASPKEGDHCDHEMAETCVDKHTALFCHEKRLVALKCRGADGCGSNKHWRKCHQGVALAGDACVAGGDSDYVYDANEAGPKALLQCINGHFVAAPSR